MASSRSSSADLRSYVAAIEGWIQAAQKAPDLLDDIAVEVAEEMLNFVRERFRTATDPYGKRWKKKKRPDGRKPLHGPTGRLKAWRVAEANARRIVIRPTVDYAVYHQSAAPRRVIPRRMMVPDQSKGWPPALLEECDKVIDDVMSAHFGAKGKAMRGKLGISSVRV